MSIVKISDFLHRVKNPVDIVDGETYKRITIKISHQGVLLRDIQKGHLIGTKKQFTVKSGQFILSKIDAMNGAFGIVGENLEGAIITGNFWVFDFDKEKVDLDWFNYFTSSNEFVEICRKASSGTTHRKYLDEEKFNNYELKLPSLQQQREVVEKVKKYQVYNVGAKSDIEDIESYFSKLKQSILSDAIQGKLVPQDPNNEPAEKLLEKIRVEKNKFAKNEKLPTIIKEDELGMILPSTWKKERLGNLCKFIDYRGKTPTKVPLGIRLVTAKNVKLGFFSHEPKEFMKDEDFDRWMTRGFPSDGDILFTTEAPLANVCVYDLGKEKVALAQRIITIHPLHPGLNFKYLLYVLMTEQIRKQIFDRQSGMTAKGVKSKKLKEIIIPIPPSQEQARIANKIELLMKIHNEQEKNIAETKNNIEKLNQAVLREVFN